MGKEQITKDRSVYAIIGREPIDHGEFLSLTFPHLLLLLDRDRRNIG